MFQTLSTLIDSHHFFHPKQFTEKYDHDETTLFRRIFGIVLVALSIPLTLGIATAFFTYWANRKVVHKEKQNQSDIDLRVQAAFGEKVEGKEKSSEQGAFEAALSALYRGDIKTLEKEVKKIEGDQLTDKVKNALIAAAVAYDRFDELKLLWGKFEKVYLPLHMAKSPEMITMIVGHVSGDKKDFVNRKYDDENTALHHQQNYEVVKTLLDKGADHLQNAEGQTPLHLCKDPKIAELLIEKFGVDILKSEDSKGQTPLFTVPMEVKKVLLEKGADVQILDSDGKSILHFFSEEPLKQHPKFIADILAKVPAENLESFVNHADNQGVVPLSLASSKTVAKSLVEAGAKYPAEGNAQPPLDLCDDPEVAKYLIEKFSNKIISQLNAKGSPPFVVNKNVDVLRVLIQQVEDITKYVDGDGDNILALFFEVPLCDHPELIHDVLGRVSGKDQRLAFINHKNNEEEVALSYELPNEVVKALVKAGATYPEKGDSTPLEYCDDPEVAKLLIKQYGAKIIFQENDDGDIPLFENEHSEVLKVMIQEMEGIEQNFGADEGSFIHLFANEPFNQHPELIQDVLGRFKKAEERSNFVNRPDKNGILPIHCPLPSDVLKAIVKAGATYPKEGEPSPLHACDDPEVAKLLIKQYGAKIIFQKNDKDEVPLFDNEHSEVLKVMIQEMEDIEQKFGNDEGSFIHLFSIKPFNQHPELIQDVLARFKKAADRRNFVNRPDKNGVLPINCPLPLDVLKAIIEEGATYPEEGKPSPLHKCEDPEEAKLLIEYFGSAIILQKDAKGRVPLSTCKNEEVFKVMIQEMEDVTVPIDDRGNTILHYFSVGFLQQHPELITDVLARVEREDELKKFVDLPNANGLTALMRNRDINVIKALLDKGAIADAVNEKNGFQPLFYAKSVEEAQALIQSGAKLDVKATKDRSVLFGRISPEVADWLIKDKGFNVLNTDEEGKQPIHYLGNFDSNVELAKVLMGDRDKDHDWQGNKPAILENAKFSAWLEAGKK